MNKEEALNMVLERKDMADRYINSTLNFGQNTVLIAMAARDMANMLLSIMDGNTPWSE